MRCGGRAEDRRGDDRAGLRTLRWSWRHPGRRGFMSVAAALRGTSPIRRNLSDACIIVSMTVNGGKMNGEFGHFLGGAEAGKSPPQGQGGRSGFLPKSCVNLEDSVQGTVIGGVQVDRQEVELGRRHERCLEHLFIAEIAVARSRADQSAARCRSSSLEIIAAQASSLAFMSLAFVWRSFRCAPPRILSAGALSVIRPGRPAPG